MSAAVNGTRGRLSILSLFVGLLATTVVGSGCSSGSGSTEHRYAAARIDPPPIVGEVSLPELTDGGNERAFVADPDDLLLVYFGYTNCPDFCPQSMSDAAASRNRLDDPERIRVAMVTIDPDRDLDTLSTYVQSFFPDGIALGTDDPTELARAADPFGVSYSITPNTALDTDAEPGDESADEPADVTVSHTTSLYAVDDRGRLVMTWPFGTAISDITADIEHYLSTDNENDTE